MRQVEKELVWLKHLFWYSVDGNIYRDRACGGNEMEGLDYSAAYSTLLQPYLKEIKTKIRNTNHNLHSYRIYFRVRLILNQILQFSLYELYCLIGGNN
ncbi:hypothetical protein EPI10_021444 [Gossypium australe]|uniref:Uncharacterized protein n=1 Tax=Gossypium australe TaxID=47621 RepID=A0A5B6WII1_9ROSI|nr:hypothetical protein EPI10_021444 [Gossypium australe]